MSKTIIITGANSGIGRASAEELAKKGHHIVMICRSKEKGVRALREIKQYSHSESIDLLIADLSSQNEIKRVAKIINNEYDSIDVLINNAGGVNYKRSNTEDGIETTFATNHLAYFLLTKLLLNKLKKNKEGRIINVASEAHTGGEINFNDLELKKNYTPMGAYCNSKLFNIIFTYELAKKLKGTDVTANCMHPGVVLTNFWSNFGSAASIGARIASPFMRTPKKGAETIVWLATSGELKGKNGGYYYDLHKIDSLPITYDESVAKKLWDISEKMTQDTVASPNKKRVIL